MTAAILPLLIFLALLAFIASERDSDMTLLCDGDDGTDAALLTAVRTDNDALLKCLLEGSRRNHLLNLSNENGVTALMLAAVRGKTNTVALLLQQGVDVNVADKEGLTALSKAVSTDRDRIVTLLVDHGAVVNQVSIEGYSPLHIAATNNVLNGPIRCPTILRTLLDAGADLSLQTSNGKTALHFAAAKHRKSIVENLLTHMVLTGRTDLIDVKDNDGATPLLWSVKTADNAIAELLVNAGASIYVKDNDGLSAMDTVIATKNAALAVLLVERSKNSWKGIFFRPNGEPSDTVVRKIRFFGSYLDLKIRSLFAVVEDASSSGTSIAKEL